MTLLLSACATPAQNTVLGLGAVGLLGLAPSTNITQTYYLGVFDPREQLPPTIYRLRVQGQASVLSGTSFASGWVRADLVDSLSGRIDFDKGKVRTTADAKMEKAVNTEENRSSLDRRLVMFGPEGFREAPKDHRLVVVMGSSPETFFSAVDRALGVVESATQETADGTDVTKSLWPDLSRMREEKRAVQTLIDLASVE